MDESTCKFQDVCSDIFMERLHDVPGAFALWWIAGCNRVHLGVRVRDAPEVAGACFERLPSQRNTRNICRIFICWPISLILCMHMSVVIEYLCAVFVTKRAWTFQNFPSFSSLYSIIAGAWPAALLVETHSYIANLTLLKGMNIWHRYRPNTPAEQKCHKQIPCRNSSRNNVINGFYVLENPQKHIYMC